VSFIEKGDFMKKQLTVAFGLAVLATPAFATKARLEALGEDNFGSYYISDNRNQFLNPAKINDNKDLVTYEFGRSSGTAAGQAADSVSSPKAEGGFNKAHGNMVYGLHFGNSTPSASLVRGLAGANLQERQPWDLFVGGDAGVKWGANLTYENTNAGTSAGGNRLSSNSLRARVGAIMGDLEAFAQVSMKNDAKDYSGNAIDGKSSYFLGAGYMLNNYKLFVDHKHIGTEYTLAAAPTTKNDWKLDQTRIGVGRQERLNDKATMFVKASVERLKVDNSDLATTGTKTTTTNLPLNVGLEYAAASWLDLRASVGHTVWSSQKNKVNGASETTRNVPATVVRAGASLKFGEFSIDGLISTANDATTGVTTIDNTATTNGGSGALRTDTLMTRVSMIYRF